MKKQSALRYNTLQTACCCFLAAGLLLTLTAGAAPQLSISKEPIEPGSVIQLQFETPMIAGTTEGAARATSGASPLVVSPALAGEFIWDHPRAGRFVATEAPRYGTVYTFSLSEGVTDLAGDPVEAFAPVEVKSEAFHIRRQTPSWFNYYEQDREPKLLFEFSGPVDAEGARKKFHFITEKGRRVGADVRHPEAGDFPEHTPPLRTWGEPEEGVLVFPRTNALVVIPSTPLPVGENWKMVMVKGIASLSGTGVTTSETTVPVGSIEHLMVNDCAAQSDYDSPRRIELSFNKDLSEGLSADDLGGWVTVQPAPAQMRFQLERRRVRIDGDFANGATYRVSVAAGLPARDGTALVFTAPFERKFTPQPAYLSLPVESATRRLSGGADFEIVGANLQSIRVRAKLVEPANHLYAMRAYELYLDSRAAEDGRPVSVVPYDAVAGKTIYTETFESSAALNVSRKLTVAWEKMFAQDEAGLVFIDVEGVPCDEVQTGGKRLVAQSLIQATDLAMATKVGAKESLVFVFSQESGKPLGGIDLTVYDREKAVLQQVRTSAEGLARVETAESAHWIMAEHGRDRLAVKFSRATSGLALWRFGVPVDYSEDANAGRRTLMFTERPVYQPGETLHLKALTRIVEGDRMRFPADGAAKLRMEGPRGQTILDRDVAFSATGALDEDIVLPAQNVGHYSLILDFSKSQEGNADYWSRNVYHHFRVDEYAPNTFEVELHATASEPVSGEVPWSLSACYLMGKPLSKANYAWTAVVSPDAIAPPGFGDFYFGWRSRSGDGERDREHSYHGRGELSGEGTAEFVLAVVAGESSPGPKRVYVNTEVTDINQQTINTSATVSVAGSNYSFGIRHLGSVPQGGDPVRIEAVAVTPAGERFGGDAPVDCLVERREYNPVRMKTASGAMVTRNEPVWLPVARKTASLSATDETGTLLAEFDPEWAGEYSVTLTGKDPGGRPVETRMHFYVRGSGERSFEHRDGVRIDIQPDKDTYAPGETAMVSIQSPIAGTALITVERSRVSRHYLREIGDSGTTVEIPIAEGDGPNVFLSAIVVRGAADCPRKYREPEFKLGFCELQVDDQSHLLEVEVAPSRPSFQPGETVVIEGRIRDHAGNPVAGAEVTLFAVDEGVLSLMGFEVPNPFGVFHAPFPLSVRSAVTLTSMLSEDPDARTFGNKGRLIGGGGDDENLMQSKMRDDFRACAYWGASERTDEKGRLRVEFEAPDSLTRYRIVAVASAGVEKFGHAESAFEIRKPLMIEPALARFGRAGDRVQAKGIVFNTSDYSGEFEVTLTLDATGRFDDGRGVEEEKAGAGATKRSRTVTLAAGETGAVVFPVRFVAAGGAEWIWDARPATGADAVADTSAAGLHDRRLSRFEVGHPMPLLKESYFSRLAPGESWEDALAQVDAKLRQGSGVVTVSISRNRMLEAVEALDYILKYPYGCVEQTTSSLMPWLRLRGMRTELPNLKKTDDEILAAIQGGADRLMGMQTASGGLGYWPGATEPMLWGSAYGGLGLTLAKQSGANVPDWNLEPLYKYLSEALRMSSNEGEHEGMINLCLGAYTLAVAGHPEHSYHELLYKQRGRLCFEARCFVAMAILESDGDRAMARALLTDAETDLKGWRYWHGAQYRRSLELMAWSMLEPAGRRADELATELLALRGAGGHWGTTHTSGWAVLALAEHAESLPRGEGALACDLSWGGDAVKLEPTGDRADASIALALKTTNRNAPLRLRVSGESPVVVHVRIESRPDVIPMEPVDRGYTIARTYREIQQDGRLTLADSLEIGDLVMVELDVESSGPARYMVIDDPLPCLFEAINPHFGSQRADKGGDSKWSYWYSDYQETRADRVVFFRNWLPSGGSYKLQYLARVIGEGEVLAPAAKIEEMYAPERFGLSAPERFVIPARPAPAKTPAIALVGE